MTSPLSLFKNILGVKDAVITKIDGGDDTSDCHVYLRPRLHTLGKCPTCGKKCSGYDDGSGSGESTWCALDLSGKKVFLHCPTQRVECPEHGVQAASVPWAFPRSRFTKNFEFVAAWLARDLSKSRVAEFLRIDWDTVGRCMSRVRQVLELDLSNCLNGLVNIGVDETSYRKGHSYITTVVNHDTQEIVWIAEGFGQAVFSQFFEKLTKEQRQSIKTVTGDGARWIDFVIQKYIPHAIRCTDLFHVVSWTTDVVDEERRTASREAKKDLQKATTLAKEETASEEVRSVAKANAAQKSRISNAIKYSKGTLAKRHNEHTENDTIRLLMIKEHSQSLFDAFIMKEQLRLVLKYPAEKIQSGINAWLSLYLSSEHPPFKELAEKIQRHATHIVNAVQTGLSNARVEAFNNKIKLIIRKAYGFRNLNNLFDMIYLVCSKRSIPLPGRGSGAIA